MKKVFLFAATAAIALSSCSKNEVSDVAMPNENPNAIGLSVGTFATKSTVTSESTLQGTGVTLTTTDATTPTLEFAYSGGWQNEKNDKTWEDVSIPMSVYSAHDGANVTVTADATGSISSYSVEDAVSAQKDLVYLGQTISSIPSGGSIVATYKHALSRIKMSNSTSTTDWTCEIDGVRLVNVMKTGDAVITPADNSIAWTTSGSAQSYDYNYATTHVATDDMFIIPQTTEEAADLTESYVEALCVVYGTDSAETPKLGFKDVAAYESYFQCELTVTDEEGQDYTGALYAKVGFPLSATEFEPGTYYNFSLNFVDKTIIAGSGYYTAEGGALTLTREDDGEVVVPEEGEETTPDESTPIGIKVSVTNWPDSDVEL